MLYNIKNITDRYPKLVVFWVISIIVLWFNFHPIDSSYFYDSNEYWRFRLEFDQNGTASFAFTNYDFPKRAYLLSFLLYIIEKVSLFININSMFMLSVIQGLFFVFCNVFVIPRLLEKLFDLRINFIQNLIFNCIVVYFWKGYFFYPLSDFYAFNFLVIGLYCSLNNNILSGLVMGVFFAGSVMIRPVYIIVLPFIIIWYIFILRKKQLNKYSLIFFKLILSIIGFIIVAWPQIQINKHLYHTFDIMPQTKIIFGENLYLNQLCWGINLQRYETFVGPKSEFPVPQMNFIDAHGSNVIDEAEKIGKPICPSTINQYADLLITYPIDFLIIYSRHIFNGLDVTWNTPYIYNFYQSTLFIRLFNYSLWFIAILFLLKNFSLKLLKNYRIYVFLLLLLPSITSIPTAIEIRFMLPFYIIAYIIICFFVLPKLLILSRKDIFSLIYKYSFYYAVFVLICFILSTGTFAELAKINYTFR